MYICHIIIIDVPGETSTLGTKSLIFRLVLFHNTSLFSYILPWVWEISIKFVLLNLSQCDTTLVIHMKMNCSAALELCTFTIIYANVLITQHSQEGTKYKVHQYFVCKPASIAMEYFVLLQVSAQQGHSSHVNLLLRRKFRWRQSFSCFVIWDLANQTPEKSKMAKCILDSFSMHVIFCQMAEVYCNNDSSG